jgi:hypothetical protein
VVSPAAIYFVIPRHLGVGTRVRNIVIAVGASHITRSDNFHDIARRCHLEGARGGNIQANTKIRGTAKQSPCRPIKENEGSRKLRLPHFQTIRK